MPIIFCIAIIVVLIVYGGWGPISAIFAGLLGMFALPFVIVAGFIFALLGVAAMIFAGAFIVVMFESLGNKNYRRKRRITRQQELSP